jgi:uncharacterized protein YbjT (DUF2867 family)
VSAIAQSGTVGETVRLPTALVQPISSDDIAAAVADYALGAPVNGTVEVAGPEALPMSDLVARYLNATRDARQVIPDIRARYFGTELSDRSLIPADTNARIGAMRFEDWLSRSLAKR